jgi:hypothetical protein
LTPSCGHLVLESALEEGAKPDELVVQDDTDQADIIDPVVRLTITCFRTPDG